MVLTHVDYVQTYFTHKVPTRIHGKPTYPGLKTLKQELRANASSVDSNLGGGNHGYLGLVLTDAEYQAIPGVGAGNLFVAPAYPPALVIPLGTDPVAALSLRDFHKDAIQAYRECAQVEKLLCDHLQNSVERKYIDAYVNEDTQKIDTDIPIVLAHLFARYGIITGAQVKAKEDEMLKTNFVPSDPMVTVYNPIEKLAKFAHQARMPYSENQKIAFALTIIRNTGDFEHSLGEWEVKPDVDKTWTNLKTHFTDAQALLELARGPSMRQAGYSQINSMAEDLFSSMDTTRMETINMMAAMDKKLDDLTQPTDQSSRGSSMEDSRISPLTAPGDTGEYVNISTENKFQMEMMKMMQMMQQNMSALQAKCNPAQRIGGGEKRGRKTPDNPSFNRRKTTMYCWTHGGCAHSSDKCNDPAPEHKSEATFANKMGGSKAFCRE